MKKQKLPGKILAVFLSLLMVLPTLTTAFPALDDWLTVTAEATGNQLRVNEDGTFRILQLSDIQDNSYLSAKALATVRLAIRRYNPNLIVLTGDNVLHCAGDKVFRLTVDNLVNEFSDASGNKIPFAVTFGNHDYEVNYHDADKTSKISLQEQYEYYLSKGAIQLQQTGLDISSVSTASENSATLWGTGYIDVYSYDGTKAVRRVILLNTGSYEDVSARVKFSRVGYNVQTGNEESYQNVVNAVNTWTNATNSAGEKLECVVYQHIALQEVYLGDSPATSILTAPTVAGVKTHACYRYIDNATIMGNTENPSSRRQYVATTSNPTLTGYFDEAPKCSYSSTKQLFQALAKDNVIGVFYGHDHGNTVSAETKITYDGVQYTLTQGFGGGIDVYDGNYEGLDPQGSCYVIDKDGDLIKEAFTYTGLLTEDITYPNGQAGVTYIKEVALFNGTSFDEACDAAREAGYIPVTRAFSEGYNDADLNSNDRGSRYFTGNGSQYECIAYKQTSNPNEAITDLRVFVTTDSNYSRNNQTKSYTLNQKSFTYHIVSGCDGNVNYSVTSNTSNAFLYYTTSPNAGAPITELIVEVQESSSANAYRTIDHTGLQIGNFAETFCDNDIADFNKAKIANMNLGASSSKVIGDSVYLFMKRYDGVSGYNTKISYEVSVGVPETVFAPGGTFHIYRNETVNANGKVTFAFNDTQTTGKLYFWCPDASGVTVTAASGDGTKGATLTSCTLSNANMTQQSPGLFCTDITAGAVSGLAEEASGVIKWIFNYTVSGSSETKTQLAYTTVVNSAPASNTSADRTVLRRFIHNFNQSAFVKNATMTYSGENGFADAFADAYYALGNPNATQAQVNEAKQSFAEYADKTSVFYIPEAPIAAVEELIDYADGYMYGICQPIDSDIDTIADTGFNWVRFDVPCPFNTTYQIGEETHAITNRYNTFKQRCLYYKAKGFKIIAVTPYPKDLLWDIFGKEAVSQPISDMTQLLTIARDVATFIYNDLRGEVDYVDAFQITNEMGLATFMQPLTLSQAADYIGVQLQVIDALKTANNNDTFPIGYNSADLLQVSKELHQMMLDRNYMQYCDFVALDLYTGNQGEATAKDYADTVKELYSITGKPVIMTEFGFWSEGGRKTAEEKADILFNNYGYHSEAEAIADGANFIAKLPSDFQDTLRLNYPDRESDWPSLVFQKYSAHMYGETSADSLNDIPHTPEGQAQYFREVMTELRQVNCLAGMMIYSWQDKEKCFNCGHTWCPYETKFGLENYDGSLKPAVAAIKELIQGFEAEDAAEETTPVAQATDTTVSIVNQYGSKVLASAVGKVYKGNTVVTNAKRIAGYTCTQSASVYADIDSAVNVTYNYTPVTYTATVKANDTTTTKTFNIDGTPLVLDAPSKSGYVFAGWKVTTAAGDTLSQTNFNKNKLYAAGTYTGMYGNVTLEAQWQNVAYTVTFDANGGSNLSMASKMVRNGESYGNLPTVTAPTGLTFASWNTLQNGTGDVITADTVCQLTADQTLYAYYSNVTDTVTYDNLFDYENWKNGITQNGTTSGVTDGTLTFDTDDRSFSLTSSSGDCYTSQSLSRYSMPVTAGTTYTFSAQIVNVNSGRGWANLAVLVFDNLGNHPTITDNNTNYVNRYSVKDISCTYTAPEGATAVTLRFGLKDQAGDTITFRNVRFTEKTVADRLDNYITYPESKTSVVRGAALNCLTEPTRVGYVFDGWYYDTALTNRVEENDASTANRIVYSKWKKAVEVDYDNLFCISEYAASNSVKLNEVVGYAKVDISAGSVTVPGGEPDQNVPYTSWGTGDGYYTIPVTGGTKYYLSFYNSNWGGNVFVNFNSGTVTDTDMGKHSGSTYIGGTLNGESAKQYTFYFVAPAGATKIGLRFGASGTQSRTYSNIKVIDEAHYYQNSLYDYGYNYVSANETYGELQTPSREGYRFDGWFTAGGTKVTASSATGSANVKLYSHWTQAYDIMYNTIFDFDQWGQNAAKQTASYQTVVDFSANSFTIHANSGFTDGDITNTANGSGAYRMSVVGGHTYQITMNISADSSNTELKQYNVLVFEWPENLEGNAVWDGYLKPLQELNTDLSPGETKAFNLTFTAKNDTDTISLRLGLKSHGESTGTFSDILIQDMTASPYPAAYVATQTAKTDAVAVQPNREGFSSDGWYDNAGFSGSAYTSFSSITGNVILYPKYTPQICSVTFKSTIGTATTVKNLAYGTSLTDGYTPTATGYTFAGWYLDSSFRTYAPTTVNGNITVYAKWLRKTYNVSYDNIFNVIGYVGFNALTQYDTHKYDSATKTLTISHKANGDSIENCGATDNFIAVEPKTEYILSADFAITGAAETSAQMFCFYYQDTEWTECTPLHTSSPTRTISDYDGKTEAELEKTYPIATPSFGSGHHYYVIKTPDNCHYMKVRFDCDNESTTAMGTVKISNVRFVQKTESTYATAKSSYSAFFDTVSYGSAYRLPTVTADSYVLTGWYTDVNCTVQANTASCTATSDHTLYSKWEAAPLDIVYDNLLDMNTWANSLTGTGKGTATDVTNANGVVTFVGNKGSKTASDYKIPVVAGKQYKFSYEQLMKDVDNKNANVVLTFYDANDQIVSTKNCRKYTQAECYEYPNINLITGQPCSVDASLQDKIGYIICYNNQVQATPYNWGDVLDSANEVYAIKSMLWNEDFGTTYSSGEFGKSDIRFYAPENAAYVKVDVGTQDVYSTVYYQNFKLQRLDTYKITQTSKQIVIGSGAGEANVQKGYTCTGWKINGTQTTVQNGISYNFTKYKNGIELTSQWTINNYRVTVNAMCDNKDSASFTQSASGGTVTVNTQTAGASATDNAVTYNTQYTVTANAANGYTFKGWYTSSDFSGSPVSTQATLTQTISDADVTLYAKFAINHYTVTWKNENGTVLETDTNVAYGATPVYNGEAAQKASNGTYHFTQNGWTTAITLVTGDTVYTAKFTQTEHTWGYTKPTTGSASSKHTKTCSVCSYHEEEACSYNDGVLTSPATCTSNGVTTYTCSKCLVTYTKAEPTLLGHNYNSGEWSWAANGKSASITFTCMRTNCGDTQTVTATVTGAQSVAPTCTAMGTTTYTAKATFNTVEYTDTKNVVDISATGHSFTGAYVNCSDGYHARKCVNGACTAVGLDGVENKTEACSGGNANCVDKAVCEKCLTAYKEVNPANHKSSQNKAQTDATESAQGYTAGVYCNACKTWVSGHNDLFYVKFLLDDGASSAYATAQVVSGNTATAPQTPPTRTGYQFKEWLGIGTAVTANNTAIVADWTPNTVNVIYDGNNATSGVPTANSFLYDKSYTVGSAPVRKYLVTFNAMQGTVSPSTAYAEYTFDKWVSSTNGTQYTAGATVNDSFAVGDATSVTLTATWTNGTLAELPTPERAGYTFGGWYYDKDTYTQAVKAEDVYTKATEIYAKWDANTASVTVNKDGKGWANAGITVELRQNGSVVYTLACATDSSIYKQQNVADGTYQIFASLNDSTVTDTGIEITVENTGTATIDYYTLTTDATDEGIASITGAANGGIYRKGESVTVTAVPETGYSFAQWQNGSTAATAEVSVTMNGAVTLKAVSKLNSYQVIYNTGDGKFSDDAIQKTESFDYKASVTAIAQTPVANKQGYHFSGWTPALPKTMPYENVTVTAQYAPDTDTSYQVNIYEQNIDDNGYTLVQSITTLTATTDTQVTYTPTAKTGFTVNTADSTLTGTVLGDESLILVVKYDRQTATVTYSFTGDVPAGTTAPEQKTYRFGKTLTVASAPAAVTGYTFKGYNKSGEFTVGTENIEIIGTWELNTHNVSYQITGEITVPGKTAPTAQNYTFGSQVSVEAALSATGYTFSGWSTTDTEVADNKLTMPDNDVVFTGSWTKLIYDIAYYHADGLDNPNPTTYTVTDAVVLKSVSKDYYEFKGWHSAEPMTEVNLTTGFATGETGAKSFYAEFTPVSYTITYQNTFDAQNGNLTSYTVESDAIVLSAIERTGYTFGGWFTDSACTDVKRVTEIAAGSHGDITLYAKWTAKQYTVTFRDYDGSLITEKTVDYDCDATPPTTGYERAYCTLNSWSGTYHAVHQNETVKAVYQTVINGKTVVIPDDKYLVVFENDDKTVLSKQLLSAGELPVYNQTPVHEQEGEITYTFIGWDKTVAAVTGDTVYTAKYKSNKPHVTVTFVDSLGNKTEKEFENGTVLTEDMIPDAIVAEAYIYNTENHYKFLTWSGIGQELTNELTVAPIYETTGSAHEMQTSVQEATCTVDGARTQYCITCPYKEVTVLPHGHKLTTHEAQPATCTQDGWREYVSCENCDYTTLPQNALGALGHQLGGWYVYVAATPEHNGINRRKCVRCEYTVEKETEFDPDVALIRTIHFVSNGKTQYNMELLVENSEGKYEFTPYTLYNTSEVKWFTDRDLVFEVSVSSITGTDTAYVYLNGKLIEANENGTYTIPAGTQAVTVQVSIFKLNDETTTKQDESTTQPQDGTCTHVCHSNNALLQVLWKIVCFFCKLFNINQYCSCGAKHW